MCRIPNRTLGGSLVLLSLLFGSACAAGPRADGSTPPGGDASAALTLEVENGFFYDVRVYLVRGSSPIPLGVVGSATTRRFRLDRARLGTSGRLRLLADPFGGSPAFLADPVELPAEGVLVWRLAHRLGFSTFDVRRP